MHLPGVRVGYVWGGPGEGYASAHLDAEQVEVYGFSSLGAALRSLRARRIDYLIGDFPELAWLAERSGHSEIITLETPLTEEDSSWAVSRNNQQLAPAHHIAVFTIAAFAGDEKHADFPLRNSRNLQPQFLLRR